MDHHKELARRTNSEDDLALAAFEFRQGVGTEARRDILVAVRQSPEETDVLEACGLAQDEHPDAYKAFLEAAGWDYSFDPLDIVTLKRRYEMDIPLQNGPETSHRTPGL